MEGNEPVLTLLSAVLALCVSLNTTLVLCWVGHSKERSASSLMTAVSRYSLDVENAKVYNNIHTFMLRVHSQNFTLSANGFFNVNKSFLAKVLGMVISFLIVLKKLQTSAG